MRCFWCNGDPEEVAAPGLSPHATWCVHYRTPDLPKGFTRGFEGGRKVVRVEKLSDVLPDLPE